MLCCPIFCLGQKNLHLLAVATKELFPFVGMWIHHLLLIKPSEVVQSLSELIDSQRTSSVKMGKGLHFYAAPVFRQCSCLSCTMFFFFLYLFQKETICIEATLSLFSYNMVVKLFCLLIIWRDNLQNHNFSVGRAIVKSVKWVNIKSKKKIIKKTWTWVGSRHFLILKDLKECFYGLWIHFKTMFLGQLQPTF